MMIKAKHHWFIYPFLLWYGQTRIKIHFNKIKMEGKQIDNDLPLLIIANHFSWWDGFFIALLNQKKFQKKFHIMMEKKQLDQNPILKGGGIFSVTKKSREAVETLRYSTELLKHSENMVALFPQGKFESAYQHPLHFEKGVEWIIKKAENRIRLVFVANQVEYFDTVKPNLFIHFEEYTPGEKNIGQIEKDYNDFFEKCYKKNETLKSD